MTSALRRSTRLVQATSVAASSSAGVSRTTAVAATSAVARMHTRDVHQATTELDGSSENDAVGGASRKRARSASVASDLTELPEDVAPAKKTKKPRKKAAVVEYTISDFPKRPQSHWKIGPHVSAAGGVDNAVLNAASIGCVTWLWKVLGELNTDAA